MEQQDKQEFGFHEPTMQADSSVAVATPRAAHQCEVMLRVAAPSGKERVLDIASGGGFAAAHFAPKVAEVIAVDRDRAAAGRMQQATQGMTNVYFEQAEATDLPFEDGSFDMVLCHEPLYHFGDQLLDVLKEVRRVLRLPEGRFIAFDVVRVGGGDATELRGADGQVELETPGSPAQGQVSAEGIIGGNVSIGGGSNIALASSHPSMAASAKPLVANYNAAQLKTLFADAMLMPVTQAQLARDDHPEDSLPDVLAAVFVAKPQSLPYEQSSSNQ